MTGLTVEGTRMTENVVQGLDSSSGATLPQNAPVESSSSVAQPAPREERVFRQHEVNDIVGRAKAEAVDRFKRETSFASHQQSPPATQITPQNTYGVSQDEIRRMAAEEAQRLRNEWVEEAQRNSQQQDAERVAKEFFQKLETGKVKHQDYDAVMKDMDFGAIPHIVQVANMMENTSDIMYELAKNPSKVAIVQQLIDISPNLAMNEMRRLSETLKNNTEAQNFRHPNEPLSQMRPSNQGMDKRGPLTVSDYKSKYIV